MEHYVWSITVQHTAAICHHRFVLSTLTALRCWLNILRTAFNLLVADFTKVFWKEVYIWMQKVNYKWHAISHFLVRSIQTFLVTITKIKRLLSTSEVCTGPPKSFPSCSFCVSQTFYKGLAFHDFSDLRSHEDAFFQFCSANVGKCVTPVLESSWFGLCHGFH